MSSVPEAQFAHDAQIKVVNTCSRGYRPLFYPNFCW